MKESCDPKGSQPEVENLCLKRPEKAVGCGGLVFSAEVLLALSKSMGNSSRNKEIQS